MPAKEYYKMETCTSIINFLAFSFQALIRRLIRSRSSIQSIIHFILILALVLPNIPYTGGSARAAELPSASQEWPAPAGAALAATLPPADATPSATPPVVTIPTGEPTATLPVPTQTITPTQAQLPTATPLPTEIPPTPTIPPSATPLPPESPTQTVSPSATITPTATAIPEITTPITFTYTVSPTRVAPGDNVTVTWQISGLEGKSRPEMVVELPAGFTPPDSLKNFYDPQKHTLQFPVTRSSGSATFQVTPEAAWPFDINLYLLSAGVVESGRHIQLEGRWPSKIGLQGGQAQAYAGKVNVSFPATAVSEPLDVEVRSPDPQLLALDRLGSFPFEVIARRSSDSQEVHQFDGELTIEVEYDPNRLPGDESTLTIFFYDTEAQTWVPLPTTIDTLNQRLSAVSNHLTFFDFDAQDWEAARLPSLSSFQVSAFSGAAAYGYPIQVPPGPGGLQPSISLSYSSQTADNSNSRTQADWVGLGWSLDVGTIQRNQNGTPNYYGDDTFSLHVDGAGGMLIPIPDADGDPNTDDYRLADNNFWFIRRYISQQNIGGYPSDTSYWLVKNKEGTSYYFGENDRYPAYPSGCPSIFMQTYQWPLDRVVDKFNNEINYSYAVETKGSYGQGCSGYQASHVLAAYPDEILYPNSRYKIKFIRTTGRLDYDQGWDNASSTVLFKRSLLSEIQVLHDGNGDGTFEETLRKYVLSYGENSQQIYPSVTWPAGGKTPTLTSIKEYGLNGYGPLPATTFIYGDNQHITQVTNGYGGTVTFTYNTWADVDGGEDVDCDTPDGYLLSGTYYLDTTFPAYCGRYTSFQKYFQPGGSYLLYDKAKKAPSSSGYLNLGVDDGVGGVWGTQVTIPADGAWHIYTSTVTLSGSAIQARPVIYCSNCYSQDYQVTPLTTHYRVASKTLQDSTTGASYTFNYTYDEPASNDASHSDVVYAADDLSHLYTPAYSQFRGHAATREIGPDGKVTTTYYYQDDDRKGTPHVTVVGTQDFYDAFDALDSSKWSFHPGSGAQAAVLANGDKALKTDNPNADWNVYLSRLTESVKDDTGFPNTTFIQFKTSGNSTQSIIALQDDTYPYPDARWRRWGVTAVFAGSTGTLKTHFYIGQTLHEETTLLNNLAQNRWYVLQLGADDDDMLIRVWDRDNPSINARFQCSSSSTCNGFGGTPDRDWALKEFTKSGTVWLDSYSEGRVYSISNALYTHKDDFATGVLPKKQDNTQYEGLKITWTYKTEEENLTFEGDSQWEGRKSYYRYEEADQGGVQYGNLTWTIESYWAAGNWQDYRATWTKYYPNAGNANLVGLPAYTNAYACSSVQNGGCYSQVTTALATGPYYGANILLSSSINIYDSTDNSTTYTTPPSVGKLTKQRTFLYFYSGSNYSDPRYADVRSGYDSWGNPNSTTQYTGEGTSSAIASSGAQTTTTCYGQTNPGTGDSCVDDGYHTYMGWQKNALNQISKFTYSYTYSAPTQEIDPNSVATTAAYDSYGRLLKIVRYGDDVNNPTVRVTYHDTTPFWTEAEQRIDGSLYFTLRKFYDGLGRKVQVQMVGAKIGASDMDVLVNTSYDAYGNVTRQYVPYEVSMGSGYRTPDTGKASTQTSYDILGRPLTVTATDETTTSYEYGDLYTKITDARSNSTTTYLDERGRTSQVTPPTGPSLTYAYNDLARTVTTTRGGASTTMYSDYAGRNTQMADADLGTWSYAYNALGLLSLQTDAKGQVSTLTYDSLGRLASKAAWDSANQFFYDDFSANRTSDWVYSSYETVPYTLDGNQVVKSTGTGNTYDANFYRTSYSLSHGKAIEIKFRRDSGYEGYFMLESSGSPYQRFGVIDYFGRLFVQYTDGNGNFYNGADVLTGMTNGVWYVLRIVVDDVGGFTATAYQQSDPKVNGTVRVKMTAGKSWRFVHCNLAGTVYLDDYREITPTIYSYDQGTNGIGQRTNMSDVSGSTTWTYDNRGRKTQESKVISGAGGGTFVTQWDYNSADLVKWMKYPGGNGEQVAYSYYRQMALNNVCSYNGSYCTANYVQSTQYDAAGRVDLLTLGTNILSTDYIYNGWDIQGGRLQQIKSGVPSVPDSLQNLVYTYDENGNVHTIDDAKAGGTQTQTFTYDDANRLTSALASGGTGGTYGTDNYSYDSSTGNLNTKAGVTYTYGDTSHKHAVTQGIGSGGTNKTITIRALGTPAAGGWPLMSLYVNGIYVTQWSVNSQNYSNYSVIAPLTGNDVFDIVFSNDYYAPPEDRNLYIDYIIVDGQTIQAEGGAAIIDWGASSYAFDGQELAAGGELLYCNGALRFVKGAGAYWARYDANGNMIARLVDGLATFFTYDAENRLVNVSGGESNTFVYDGDGNRVTVSNGYRNLAAGIIATSDATLIFPEAITNGDTWANDGGSNGEYAYTQQNGLHYVQIDLGAVYTVDKVKVWHFAMDGRIYHKTRTQISVNGTTWTDIFSSTLQTEYSETSAGRTYTFTPQSVRYVRDYLNGSTSNAEDHWVEIEAWGRSTTAYIGNYYEWNGQANNQVKYYYAGSQRVAMRLGNGTGTSGLDWLLGDHLGSTTVTADANRGTLLTELRYKAWGETRYSWGTTPTSYRFTGQRSEESSIGLYYYGARWYDPVLGRWNQPDTVIPENQGVQAWDRMAYTNNNPVRFNDPSGHMCSDPEDPHQRCDGGPNRNYYGNTESNTQSEPTFDGSLGGNNEDSSEKDGRSGNREQEYTSEQRIAWTLVGAGVIVAGVAIFSVGLSEGPLGAFLMTAGMIFVVSGATFIYEVNRPTDWPSVRDYLGDAMHIY